MGAVIGPLRRRALAWRTSAEDSGGILSAPRVAAASAERVWRGSGELVCPGDDRPGPCSGIAAADMMVERATSRSSALRVEEAEHAARKPAARLHQMAAAHAA